MNNLEKLVGLKETEFELKDKISEIQKLVIEEAIALGKKGTLANVNGSKVVMRMVAIKAKPTERLLSLQSHLENRKMELISLDLEALDLTKEIDRLEIQAVMLNRSLTQVITELIACDPQAMHLEEKIEEETAALDTGELTPQLAVTLAK